MTLKKQREEIRKTVFEPSFLQECDTFRIFWEQLGRGGGEGVLGS